MGTVCSHNGVISRMHCTVMHRLAVFDPWHMKHMKQKALGLIPLDKSNKIVILSHFIYEFD